MGMVLSREIMLRPYYEIHLDNKKLDASLKKYIVSVEVEESDTEADAGRITVADIDFKFSNMTKLSENMPIKIYMGHANHHRLMLKGEVEYIEADFGEDGIPYIIIGAIDNSSKMNTKKKSRTWTKKKASEVVKEIAKEYGFKPKVEESLNVIDQITQEEETDAQLVARLADDEGFVFLVSPEKDTLYWGDRFSGLTATDNLYYNSGDHSVITFKPTLVKKNKAQLAESSNSSSSIADDTGEKVTTVDKNKLAPSSISEAGGDRYVTLDMLTGSVGGSGDYEENVAGFNTDLLSKHNRSSYEEDVAGFNEESLSKLPSPSRNSSGSYESGVAGISLSLDRKY